MQYLDSSLFAGITKKEYRQMMECFTPKVHTYKSGAFICGYDEKTSAVGIIKSGMVRIERTDINGAHTVLETIAENGIFGEIFYRGSTCVDEIFVYCQKDCEILFIDYHHITKRCVKACAHHSLLVGNMLSIIAWRSAQLSTRVEMLSRRTIRDKLLSYFTVSLSGGKARGFILPFSYAMLADYLCVDRSAMMREMKKLKDEGIIQTERRHITLLKDSPF